VTTINLFKNEKDSLSIPAGRSIFFTGQTGDVMYVVIEGEVEIMVNNQLVETIREGGIFGEMALLDEEPRSADAIAKTDCKLATVNEKRFLYLVHNTPYFSIEIMRVMANRLRRENTVDRSTKAIRASSTVGAQATTRA